MIKNGRICVAAINSKNIEYVLGKERVNESDNRKERHHIESVE